MKYKLIEGTDNSFDFYTGSPIISVDCEYTELNVRKAELLSISIGVSEDLTYIFSAPYSTGLLKTIKYFFETRQCIFTWNGYVDHFMLSKVGAEFPRELMFDAMLAEHLINENWDHGLGDFAFREYGDTYKNEFWSKYDSYQEAPKDVACEYEMRDGCYTFRAGIKYLSLLKDKMKLVEHVHKLHWVLCDVESEGIKIDVDLLTKTEYDMRQKIQLMLPELRETYRDYCETWEIKKWEEEIEKRKTPKGKSLVAKPVFSFTSDRQIGEIIYGGDYLGIPAKEKTKKGSPSTSYDALQEISKEYPEIQNICDYKQTKAVYGTFVKGLLERIEDGKVHPHFSVNGTTTGRLSSSNPNFQNMPQEGVIRNFILPDTGCLIVGADYESLEVGVELNLTEDKNLLKIFQEGASKHDITAAAVGMSRKDAKTLNFLCQYGGGVWKIQDTFKVSEKTAQEIYDKYWIAYAGVMEYKKRVFKELADTNQVVNCFGRVRHFSPPKNKWERESQQRQAYSHMVQGPGAEMTNCATYRIANYFKVKDIGRLLFSVHDEIVCSIKQDLTDHGKESIVVLMEQSNVDLNFKYRIRAKSYGGFPCWRKA
jgi:DNA polymerase I-like protein with 3'-5' exonuclease and polymerase domains